MPSPGMAFYNKVCLKLIKVKRLDWANWLVVRLMNHEQQIQYAIYAAEQVIDIYEKQYPGEDRPRKAIEAAKEYLKAKTAVDAARAARAAWAAWDAARAAGAAWAAGDEMKIKIIKYGLNLLKGADDAKS